MNGAAWKYSETVNINNETWYQLGTNQWVQGSYTTSNGSVSPSTIRTDNSKKGVLTINYLYGYSILVYKTTNGAATSPAKYVV